MSRQLVRSIKNISYSSTEVKVRNVTSNDPWGPSGSDLDQISKMTFQPDKLKGIVKVLNKRLSSKRNSALHVLKSLTIIQYCLQVGSQDFVDYYKVHSEIVSRLVDYDILNKTNPDTVNVRKRSRYISKLLRDDQLLASKRENFHQLRSEMLIPGIKSSERDKLKHLRYSLDQNTNTLEQEEITTSISPVIGGARSTSLDIKRLDYYNRNRSALANDDKRLHHITEENIDLNDDKILQEKIDALTNPFRNSVFVDNFESLSLSGSNTSSSAGSLSDDRGYPKPFVQVQATDFTRGESQ